MLSFPFQIFQIFQKMQRFFLSISNAWSFKIYAFQILTHFCKENFYKFQLMKRKILWFSSLCINIFYKFQGSLFRYFLVGKCEPQFSQEKRKWLLHMSLFRYFLVVKVLTTVLQGKWKWLLHMSFFRYFLCCEVLTTVYTRQMKMTSSHESL